MTLSLRARILAIVPPMFLVTAGLAVMGLPSSLLAVVSVVMSVVSVVSLVLFTRSFTNLTRYAADAAQVAGVPLVGRGDGTELVRETIASLLRQVEETTDTLAKRDYQFETALYEVSTALTSLSQEPRKTVEYQPPACPWDDRATATATAMKSIATVLSNATRRAAGFHGVFNDLPDPVIVIDAEGKVLLVNKVAADLFDVESGEVARKPLSALFLSTGADLWDPEQSPPIGADQLKAWIANPVGGNCEAVAATPEEGGTRVTVSVRQPADRGSRLFTVLLLKDQTRQMKKDSDVRLHHRRLVAQRLCLLIENEAKPALEAIRTNATLLAQAAKQAGQRERFVPKVQRMMDELSRQEVVITLLGWLGRLTKTFGSSQDLGEVRLRAAVDEVGEKLTAVYGDRTNELAVTGDAGWLIADEEWVTVMLTGLLLHANLSCKGGKVEVDLRRRSLVQADGEQGEVLVRYPGAMLPEEALADVREPFRRPNSLALESTSELGFPLGLAVANRITSLMGGQLAIDAEGTGCCVRVTLPTRATSSRVESIAAMVRTPAGRPVETTETTDLLSEWTVGGQSSGLELVSTATPAPVGAADLSQAPLDPPYGENVGDWFPTPAE